MSDPITLLGTVLSADVARLDAVSQNVANGTVNGFRAVRFEPGRDATAGTTRVVQRDGSLAQTGRALDLALTGAAFFALSTADGIRYTRDGAFQRSPEGLLVAADGALVLGEGGPLRIGEGRLSIDARGELQQDGTVIGRLRLDRFADAAQLSADGAGRYRYAGEATPAASYTVHQGALERANVDSAGEMVRLIEVARHIESVQRTISAYDQLLGTGINQIGKDQ